MATPSRMVPESEAASITEVLGGMPLYRHTTLHRLAQALVLSHRCGGLSVF